MPSDVNQALQKAKALGLNPVKKSNSREANSEEVTSTSSSEDTSERSIGRNIGDAVAGFGTGALKAMAYNGRALAAAAGLLAKGVEKGITPIVEGVGGKVAKAEIPLPSPEDSVGSISELQEDAGLNDSKYGRGGQIAGDIAGSFITPASAIGGAGGSILQGSNYMAGRAEEEDVAKQAAIGGAVGGLTHGAIKGLTAGAKGIGSYFGRQGAINTAKSQVAKEGLLNEVSDSVSDDIYPKARSFAQDLIKTIKTNPEKDKLYADVLSQPLRGKVQVSNPLNSQILAQASKQMEGSTGPLGMEYRAAPVGSIKQVDSVIKHLSEQIDTAGPQTAAGKLLINAKNDLIKTIDLEQPGYAKARSMASSIINEVKNLNSSGIGAMAKSNEGTYSNITKKLFKEQDVATGVFQKTRDLIYRENPELYKDLVRKEIENKAGTVAKSASPLIDLVNGLTNTGNKSNLWREALNVPDLVITRGKLEILADIATQSKNPGLVTEMATRPMSMISSISLRDLKVANQKALKFLTSTANEDDFARLVTKYGDNQGKLIQETIKLMNRTPITDNIGKAATAATNQQIDKRKER